MVYKTSNKAIYYCKTASEMIAVVSHLRTYPNVTYSVLFSKEGQYIVEANFRKETA